ncbi:MAG: TniQ family protein [Pusillimonas sp.]
MSLVNTFAPYEDESGFGYYRRLATGNALWGWRELAAIANVSRSRTALMARPEHLAAELGLELEWTRHACEQEKAARAWRGLHRVRADAVCPDCLNKSNYLRQHWEHAYVTCCPVHRIRLVDRCDACGENLSIHREHIELCPCGHDLRESQTSLASNSERWLSVLIASGGRSSGGVLPKVQPVSVTALCDLVRVLCLYYDPNTPAPSRSAANVKAVRDAVELLAPLQSLLNEWPKGFELHVVERMAAGNPDARTLNKLLGPWYILLRKHCQGNAMETFLRAVIAVAARGFDGVLGLDSATHLASDMTDYVRLPDAAKAIGVSRDRLQKAAKNGECAYRTLRLGTRGLVYEVPKSEVARISKVRQGWLVSDKACKLAGVPESVLKHMMLAGVIASDVRWRNDILKAELVEAKSIEALFDSLKMNMNPSSPEGEEIVSWAEFTSRRLGDGTAIQSVMRAARDGELRAVVVGPTLGRMGFLRSEVARYFGTPVLEAGMSLQQLSKSTGWKWESIAHWISEGLLGSEQILLRGKPCRVVLPEHLLEFRRTYIPLADLAKAMDVRASALADRLYGVELIGAKPLPNGLRRGGLIRVADLGHLALRGVAKGEA